MEIFLVDLDVIGSRNLLIMYKKHKYRQPDSSSNVGISHADSPPNAQRGCWKGTVSFHQKIRAFQTVNGTNEQESALSPSKSAFWRCSWHQDRKGYPLPTLRGHGRRAQDDLRTVFAYVGERGPDFPTEQYATAGKMVYRSIGKLGCRSPNRQETRSLTPFVRSG
jgi:hypothetical protein